VKDVIIKTSVNGITPSGFWGGTSKAFLKVKKREFREKLETKEIPMVTDLASFGRKGGILKEFLSAKDQKKGVRQTWQYWGNRMIIYKVGEMCKDANLKPGAAGF